MKRAFVLLLILIVAFPLCSQLPDLKISEILFNPETGGADYVELYNAGEQPVRLDELRLAQWRNNSVQRLYALSDTYEVSPHAYVVITTDAAYLQSRYTVRYPEHLIEVASMPTYNDASGTVLLCTSDSTVIERFDYSEAMHSPLLRKKEGVSLERRSFTRPANDASNWFSAASTAGYGTPTYRNSQSQETLFLEDEFAVSADVISPDGDGYQDLIDLSWQLSRADLSANIALFDSRGRIVRHLLRAGSLGSQGVLTWNGTNDEGIRCRRGNYLLRIETYDVSGRQQVLKRTITLINQ